MKHLNLALTTLMVTLGAAHAQTTVTPIFVQPPQLQVPAPTPPPNPVPAPTDPLQMPSSIQVTPGTLTPPATTTTDQVAPTNTTTPAPTFTFGPTPTLQQTTTVSITPAQPPERFLLWGGTNLTTATGGINFGVSYPLLQVRGVNVLARGSGEVGLVASQGISTPLLIVRADALASYPLGQNMIYGGPGLVGGFGNMYGLGLSLGYRANFSDRFGGFIEGQVNRIWSGTGGHYAPGLRTGLTYRF